jgi:antitoxin HicB
MSDVYKVPLVLTRQPEGGFTVTSPALPELITEGDTLPEALDHARDALAAVLELYHDLGRSLPASLRQDPQAETITLEYPLTVA